MRVHRWACPRPARRQPVPLDRQREQAEALDVLAVELRLAVASGGFRLEREGALRGSLERLAATGLVLRA